MKQSIVAHDVLQRRVPRRTKFFLLISNNFQYIIIVPILALIMFLNIEPAISIVLGLLGVFVAAAFWTAFKLDVSLNSKEHPHNRQWNHFKSTLSIFAPLVQNLAAWKISLAGWIIASIPIVIVVLLLNSAQSFEIDIKPRLGFDLYWLAYIPVLIWISFRAKDHTSEWFGLFWFISALTYSVCFFIVYENLNFQNALHLTILMGWFLFLSLLIHYLFRRLAIFRGQAELLQAVTERLRNDRRYTEAFDTQPVQNEPDPVLNEIAEYIGRMLLYDRVFILIPDSSKNVLYMKGRYGLNAPWPEKGWSIKDQNSITGWVALNKTEHLCDDTENCDLFFNPDKAYPCKSEATVPILVEGECVGIIDIESAHKYAFHQSDIRLLWQIANSIGAALGYERHVSREINKTYKLFEEASDILVHSKSLNDALQKVAQKLRVLFDADLVILYKHAVSTCVPLPGLIIDGDAIYPELLGSTIRADSRLNQLIQQSDALYVQPNANSDPLLLGENDGFYTSEEAQKLGTPYRFVKRENIQSMIYVKLGLGNELVGSLFLNFRKKINFQTQTIESLQAFANILTMGLVFKRQTERAVGPLAGTIPLAHSTAEAAFESVNRDFNNIDWGLINNIPGNESLLMQIETYKEKLDELRREWTNLILVEQVNLHRSSLVEPIAHLETKLRSMFPNIDFDWDSREFLDIPTDELGEVIYKVIAEGVSNALVHARASHISIQCKKENSSYQISVINDGKSIDVKQAARINDLLVEPLVITEPEKQTGIISILVDSRRWFGATWSFSSKTKNNTELVIVFPLPIDRKQDEYFYED